MVKTLRGICAYLFIACVFLSVVTDCGYFHFFKALLYISKLLFVLSVVK